MLDVIQRAATDPTVDIDKMERLLAMRERYDAEQRKTAFLAALSALEAELPQIAKSGTILDREGNVRNRFAKMEDVDAAIRPLCKEHGFAFSFDSMVPVAGNITYTCTMSHREGHSETKQITLPIDKGGGRSDVQSVGSTTSYARRYLLGMHLHLVTRDEDDDGAGGRGPITAEQAELLRALMTDTKTNEAKFLNWLAAPSIEEVPAANFARAMRALEEKGRGK